MVIEPSEAAVVRDVYRMLVEEQLSCRHITKRLNASHTRTPTGKNHVRFDRKTFFRKLLKGLRYISPRVIITDQLKSYGQPSGRACLT